MDELRTKLVAILKKLDNVMVTTTAENGTLRGRPMAVAGVEDNGEVWFVTAKQSEKTDEVRHDSRAVITAQQGALYVSLSGTIEVLQDRARVHALWKEAWKAWFPDGKDDPSIVLLRLRPEIGEYWDNTGAKGLKLLFQAAKAILDGKAAEPNDPDQHAKVPL